MVLVDAVGLDLGVVEQVEEGRGGDDHLQERGQPGPFRVDVLVQPAPVACGVQLWLDSYHALWTLILARARLIS